MLGLKMSGNVSRRHPSSDRPWLNPSDPIDIDSVTFKAITFHRPRWSPHHRFRADSWLATNYWQEKALTPSARGWRVCVSVKVWGGFATESGASDAPHTLKVMAMAMMQQCYHHWAHGNVIIAKGERQSSDGYPSSKENTSSCFSLADREHEWFLWLFFHFYGRGWGVKSCWTKKSNIKDIKEAKTVRIKKSEKTQITQHKILSDVNNSPKSTWLVNWPLFFVSVLIFWALIFHFGTM